MPTKTKTTDSYQVITDRLIELIETEKTIPWTKPWKPLKYKSNLNQSLQFNIRTREAYNGSNQFLLGIYADCHFNGCNAWGTSKMINEHGGRIVKGSKGYPVIFWKFIKVQNENDETEVIPMLKHYTVFNIEQTTLKDNQEFMEKLNSPASNGETGNNDGIDISMSQQELVVEYFSREKCQLDFGGDRAYYNKSLDKIQMPYLSQFNGFGEYYHTLFHEMVHSSGHKERLARPALMVSNRFGSTSYSKEELVAELGANYLSSFTGNTYSFEQSADYIKGWTRKLKSDKRLFVNGMSQASKATEFILSGKKND